MDSHSFKGSGAARYTFGLDMRLVPGEGAHICEIRSYRVVGHLGSERIIFDIEIDCIY